MTSNTKTLLSASQPAQDRVLIAVVAKAHKLNIVAACGLAGTARKRLCVRIKDVLHHGKAGRPHTHLCQFQQQFKRAHT